MISIINFEKFYSIIKPTIENYALLKKLSRKQQRLKNKPWITKSLFNSIKNKQNCIKLFTYLNYIQKKSITNCILTQQNYNNKITDYKNNPKKTWDVLRFLLPLKTKSNTPNSLTVKNSPITAIAEEFNYHFATVDKSLAS